MKRINVTKSSMPELEEYVEELKPVWESRWLSNRGAASIKFEEDLKRYLGVEDVYCFANGHVALECALEGLSLPRGGEVITTPYTHVSTTHAIVRRELVPVFVDVEPETYTINPELIEVAITKKTVAIVATHVYGFPCKVDEIQKIADKYNLKVVYDAAHAFGVKYKGVGIGNYGDLSMFSTHATKVFHTIEGGIVTSKLKDYVKLDKMRKIVNFGFSTPEDIEHIGTNARMNEFECVMGIVNLRHIDDEIEKRKKAAEVYWDRLENVAGIKLIKPDDDTVWNYAYFPIFFEDYKYSRDEIQKKLEDQNIYARKYFYPITNEARCYSGMFESVVAPIAKKAANNVLTLPMYADLTYEEVNMICDIILGD